MRGALVHVLGVCIVFQESTASRCEPISKQKNSFGRGAAFLRTAVNIPLVKKIAAVYLAY